MSLLPEDRGAELRALFFESAGELLQVINDVGRRFWVDSSNTFDLFASAVVMF